MKIKVFANSSENQFGFNVSIVKYDDNGNLIQGFTLDNFKTRKEQMRFATDLATFLEYELIEELFTDPVTSTKVI